MATSTGPNLEQGRRAVENLMDDTCDVYAPGAQHTSTMDPVTLKYTATATRGVKIYSNGRCKIKDATNNSRGGPIADEAGKQLSVVATKVDFPLGDVPAGGFPEGCTVVCQSSRRNAFLVGNEYTVREIIGKTLQLQYTVLTDKRKLVDP